MSEEQEVTLRGSVFKLRVTKPEIREKLLQNMRASIYAYNWGIRRYLDKYKELNEGASEIKFPPVTKTMGDIGKEFTQFKKTPDGAWLNNVDSTATSTAICQKGTLCKALNRFVKEYYTKGKQKNIWEPINRRKRNKKQAEFPRHAGGFPKTQRVQSVMSYTTDGRHVKVQGNQIYLPKIGYIPVWNWQDLPTEWRTSLVVSTDGIDFYVSLISERAQDELDVELDGILGIDLGLKTLATLSDGTKIMNPADLPRAKKLEALVKHYQRRLSILEKHAPEVILKNGRKGIKRSRHMKRIHELLRKRQIDLNNCKMSYMKQMASKIKSMGYKHIVFEDLNISGMFKNKKLAPKLQKTGMYAFKLMVKYMTEPYGTIIHEADRFFASSQICCNCGFKNEEMKNLSKRTFVCPSCGYIIDRDVNASINLKGWVDKQEQKV